MQIFVKTMKGDSIELSVEPDQTILDLKTMVKEKRGDDIEMQKLILRGKKFDDNTKTLVELGIKDKDTFVLMVSKVLFLYSKNFIS